MLPTDRRARRRGTGQRECVIRSIVDAQRPVARRGQQVGNPSFNSARALAHVITLKLQHDRFSDDDPRQRRARALSLYARQSQRTIRSAVAIDAMS